MKTMSTYESHGRTRQKALTKAALVAGARSLLERGCHPTVEEVADAVGVSRATAYRYFPSRAALVLAAFPAADTRTLLGDDPPSDPEARLERVIRAFTRMTLETEPQLRMMLRLSLEPAASDELALRQGRAIGWFEEALAPLRGRVPPRDLRRLVLALRSSCGIEALVWLTDVAGLSREEAARQMWWSARELLHATLARCGPT